MTRRPRAATPARLLAASLRPSNDQGAHLRRALRPSVHRAATSAHFDPMEITAQ